MFVEEGVFFVRIVSQLEGRKIMNLTQPCKFSLQMEAILILPHSLFCHATFGVLVMDFFLNLDFLGIFNMVIVKKIFTFQAITLTYC